MKQMTFELQITDPAGAVPIVDYRRHFTVEGRILGNSPVPQDAVLTIRLLDDAGHAVRTVRQEKKNNSELFLDHPCFTRYPDPIDPDLSGLKHFGFPPLMVRDAAHPEQSLKDATIKCFYDDEKFKAMIVTATDAAHGLALPDGMSYTDENGCPYDVLPKGKYTIEVTLHDGTGQMLGAADKPITIGEQTDLAICRFNPPEHRRNMEKWCREQGIPMGNDVLPGYLEPYAGQWLYHMGLLPLYRAGDVAQYLSPRVHMFLYDITEDSTSYATELSYLQSQGRVADEERFAAYYYDIGEAMIGKGRPYEQQGAVKQFAEGSYLAVCRVDVVNEKAEENVFRFEEEAVQYSLTDQNNFRVPPGCVIAIAGVVRPWQMAPEDFILKPDNTYEIKNKIETLHYTFDDGSEVKTDMRKLMLERIGKTSIGRSVFEFYNLFHIGGEYAGKTVSITIEGIDSHGSATPAKGELTLFVEE